MIKLTPKEFGQVVDYIYKKYGIDLTKKQFLIESKLNMELEKRGISNFAEFWRKLQSDFTGELSQMLIDQLTTNYTYFYREEKHFNYLRDKIVPKWNQSGEPVHYVLCAGSATGQEIYTVAMQLLDCQRMGILKGDFRVHGVDISQRSLDTAKKGVYPLADGERLPKLWMQSYCHQLENGSLEIRSCVKEKVQFFKANLSKPLPYLQKFHLVFCRNVMIYFDVESRKKLLENLETVMHPGGYLIIGHAETIQGKTEKLKYIEPTIYERV